MFTIENHILKLVNEKGLLQADIPEGVTSIAEGAFRDCKALMQVELPETLKTIGDGAFEGCTSLKSIDLTSVTSIGERAFLNCQALEEVTLGQHIGFLCNAVFAGCTSLNEIALPSNLTYIGCECFKDCTSLSKVDLGEVREIDNNAFEHCRDLCTLHLPKSLFHIGPNAFSFCSSLTTVTAQNRFMDIDETAFENTVNLIFKAVQFSTSFEYAQTQGYRFKPTVNEERYRKVTSEQVSALKQKGIMFQMKVLSAEEAVIRYDEGQRMMIESIIGKPAEKKEGDR